MLSLRILKVIFYFFARMVIRIPMLLPVSLVLYITAIVVGLKGKLAFSEVLHSGAKRVLLKIVV